MSKKKKTRAQKAEANIRRMQQFDNSVKLGDNMSSGMNSSFTEVHTASVTGGTSGARVSLVSPANLAESEHIMRDIRKCLYLIVLFGTAFVVVYFINQKTGFLNSFGVQILNFLIKK